MEVPRVLHREAQIQEKQIEFSAQQQLITNATTGHEIPAHIVHLHALLCNVILQFTTHDGDRVYFHMLPRMLSFLSSAPGTDSVCGASGGQYPVRLDCQKCTLANLQDAKMIVGHIYAFRFSFKWHHPYILLTIESSNLWF